MSEWQPESVIIQSLSQQGTCDGWVRKLLPLPARGFRYSNESTGLWFCVESGHHGPEVTTASTDLNDAERASVLIASFDWGRRMEQRVWAELMEQAKLRSENSRLHSGENQAKGLSWS